jgi:hypothetical protein
MSSEKTKNIKILKKTTCKTNLILPVKNINEKLKILTSPDAKQSKDFKYHKIQSRNWISPDSRISTNHNSTPVKLNKTSKLLPASPLRTTKHKEIMLAKSATKMTIFNTSLQNFLKTSYSRNLKQAKKEEDPPENCLSSSKLHFHPIKKLTNSQLLNRKQKLLSITKSASNVIKESEKVKGKANEMYKLTNDIHRPVIPEWDRIQLNTSNSSLNEEYQQTNRVIRDFSLIKTPTTIQKGRKTQYFPFINIKDYETESLGPEERKSRVSFMKTPTLKENTISKIGEQTKFNKRFTLNLDKIKNTQRIQSLLEPFSCTNKDFFITKEQQNIEDIYDQIEKNERKLKELDNVNNLFTEEQTKFSGDLKKFKMKKLAQDYLNEIDPYLNHCRERNVIKYDFESKLRSGEVIKDEFATNVMNKMIPGNFINFTNENTNNIKALQPRFVKRRFRKSINVFEGDRPKLIETKKDLIAIVKQNSIEI